MKRLSIIMTLFCLVMVANALDQRQTQINTIKKSKDYLYSDITMPTPEGATSQAFNELQQEILVWVTDRAERKVGITVSPKDINKLVDTIMVRRAEMYRVFAYVKKLKIAAFYAGYQVKLDQRFDCDDGHQPPLEPERPSIAQVDSVLVTDSLVKDTVASERIVALLRKFSQRTNMGTILQIMKAKNFFELRQIMEPLKQKGEILDYGKYATAKNPEDCYLIVYDPAGNIRAFLGKGKEERQNLKTGKLDSIENYHGCGAIWFRIKAPSDFPQGLRSAEEKQL